MLRNTFCHLPHIGRFTEQRLWQAGIESWDDLIEGRSNFARRFQHLNHLIEVSKEKLKQCNAKFFSDRLVSDQHWRIFSEFRNSTAYIDIETTGLSKTDDHITTIALYDGKQVFHYVYRKNLNQFKEDINNYKILVTYNGKCFDVPFIEHQFGIQLKHVHLDLRYLLRSIGITGGLKKCEHQLGISRGELEGVNGFFAVLLWKDYLRGNKKALDTLLAYNIEDTINLEKLMIHAYEKKIAEIQIRNKARLLTQFNARKTITIQFQPDMDTINRIKNKHY
jgi:uncharacterized protein YprB with RNaseH-like and TPR domain